MLIGRGNLMVKFSLAIEAASVVNIIKYFITPSVYTDKVMAAEILKVRAVLENMKVFFINVFSFSLWLIYNAAMPQTTP